MRSIGELNQRIKEVVEQSKNGNLPIEVAQKRITELYWALGFSEKDSDGYAKRSLGFGPFYNLGESNE